MSNPIELAKLRAGLAGQFQAQLGRRRAADAEWLAEQVLKHYATLAAAGSGVIAATAEDVASPEQLNERLREHNQEFLEAATGVVLVAVQQALALGLRRG